MKVQSTKRVLTGAVLFTSLPVVLWAQHYYSTSCSPVLNWSDSEPRARLRGHPCVTKPRLSSGARVIHTNNGARERAPRGNFPDSLSCLKHDNAVFVTTSCDVWWTSDMTSRLPDKSSHVSCCKLTFRVNFIIPLKNFRQIQKNTLVQRLAYFT